MFCKNCGNKLKENAMFCDKCGTKKEQKEISQKKQNKKIRIIIITAFLLFLFGIGGFFLISFLIDNKPIDEVWGEKYYVYLNKLKEKKKINDFDDIKLGFYELEEIDDPIMVLKYEKNDDTYSNIYYIENDKIKEFQKEDPAEIEYLYNIDEKRYDYYFHEEDNDIDQYQRVIDAINEKEDDDTVYTFQENEKTLVISDDGKELSISKFDETFIEVEEKTKMTNFDSSINEKKLKQLVKDTIANYKSQEEMENLSKKETTKMVSQIEKKKKQIEEAFGDKVLTCTANDSSLGLDYNASISIGFVNNRAKNTRILISYDLSDYYINAEKGYENLQKEFAKRQNKNLKTNTKREGDIITVTMQGKISEVSDFIGIDDDVTGLTYSETKKDAENSNFICK